MNGFPENPMNGSCLWIGQFDLHLSESNRERYWLVFCSGALVYSNKGYHNKHNNENEKCNNTNNNDDDGTNGSTDDDDDSYEDDGNNDDDDNARCTKELLVDKKCFYSKMETLDY